MNALHQIAGKIAASKDFTEDMSLRNGQAGMALFLFHYARVIGSEPYYEVAQSLLVDNYRYLLRQVKQSFSPAVPGMGWLISHLGHQQLIGIDTDEMLEKVDQVIFDKLQFGFSRLSDQGGLLDMTGYLLQRYVETGSDMVKMRIVERLLLVIDEIRIKMDEGLFSAFDRYYAPDPLVAMGNKTRCLSAILYFIGRIKELGLYPVIIGEMQLEIITLLDGAEKASVALHTNIYQELGRVSGMPDLGLSGGLAGAGMVLLEEVSGRSLNWEAVLWS